MWGGEGVGGSEEEGVKNDSGTSCVAWELQSIPLQK